MRAALVAALVTVAVAGCARRGDDRLADDAAEVRPGSPIAYDVAITGDIAPELVAFLRSVSNAVADVERPPTSLLVLRRRAATDAERLTSALASEGYYEGSVTATVAEPTADAPARIDFAVSPGRRYVLAARSVEVSDGSVAFVAPSPTDLGLRAGAPARAAAVLDAEQALLDEARRSGHPRAALGDRETVIDPATGTMDVVLRIAPGPRETLARPTFEGADGIAVDHLQRYVAWQPGDPFHPDAIRDTRRNLVGTSLFRTVDVRLAEPPPATGDTPVTPATGDTPVTPATGDTPVTIVVEQRLRRTVSAGARVATDGGPGITLGWEHRNVLGAGERFRAELDADPLVQMVTARLRKPDPFGLDSALLAEADLVREDTDAYESLEVAAGAGLDYRFSDDLQGTAALRLAASEITDGAGRRRFGLASLPAVLRWDTTANALDPEQGVRWSVELTPFQDLVDPGLQFNRVRLGASTYVRVANSPRVVLAFRGVAGTLLGAERDDIPANERFYAGGGGSLRGIPFQLAAPLDDAGDPIGGRSLLELSAEVRYAITETIGAVAFVDAGNAYEAPWPDFADGLEVGAGLGVRYATPFGPLRVDVAVLIDRRAVDDAFQVYVSLGQAF